MCRQSGPFADGMCWGRLVKTVLILLLAVSSALAQTPVNDLVVEFEERMQAAFAAVGNSTASQEARLDDLATRHSRRVLADGRPSVAQAAANIRLWEQRIGGLQKVKGDLARELDDLLTELASNIGRVGTAAGRRART